MKNWIGELSSNSGQVCLHSLCIDALKKGMNLILSLSIGKIAGLIGLSHFKGKSWIRTMGAKSMGKPL